MPTVWDHLLVVCVTILLPIHDLLFWYPRLLRADSARISRARRQAYLESMLVEWGLVGATVVLWTQYDRGWGKLGLSPPGGWGFWVGLVVALAVIGAGTWQRLSVTRDPSEETRDTVLRHLRPLRPLLPHTPPEMVQFTLVSITAGICEEILFRGFLIGYLSALVPTVPALAIAALLFGMAHAYQGTRGVVQTGVVGAGLAILYVLTGSLWVPMAVHLFVDLNSGLLAYAYLGPGSPPREADPPPPPSGG